MSSYHAKTLSPACMASGVPAVPSAKKVRAAPRGAERWREPPSVVMSSPFSVMAVSSTVCRCTSRACSARCSRTASAYGGWESSAGMMQASRSSKRPESGVIMRFLPWAVYSARRKGGTGALMLRLHLQKISVFSYVYPLYVLSYRKGRRFDGKSSHKNVFVTKRRANSFHMKFCPAI